LALERVAGARGEERRGPRTLAPVLAALLCCLAFAAYAVGVVVFAIFGAWGAMALMGLGLLAGPALYVATCDRGVAHPAMIVYAGSTCALMAWLGLFS
jgi:hypothetical protein